MTQSMTAFASGTGVHGQISWAWEMRGVNARGLDLRLRIPERLDGLEATLRKSLSAKLSRGNITLNLRLSNADAGAGLVVDPDQLDVVLSALDQVQERAFELGVTLAQPNAADVLGQRGVLVSAEYAAAPDGLVDVLDADFTAVLNAFMAMRAQEGAALSQVIADQLHQIEALIAAAKTAASARKPEAKAAMAAALSRVMDEITEVDEARVAQELALIAVRSDVTEEIDRLTAHVAAARDLLNSAKPSGRKLDFLAQEFNREANTLCAKAGAPALTSIGLDLKAVIDQMREQIQNVE